jgi:hypothetical protein
MVAFTRKRVKKAGNTCMIIAFNCLRSAEIAATPDKRDALMKRAQLWLRLTSAGGTARRRRSDRRRHLNSND